MSTPSTPSAQSTPPAHIGTIQPRHSTARRCLAITLDGRPPALRSTRNRPRTAVRQGASWTAAYHRQLNVAAAARPIRGSVGASASLLPSGPGDCSPQTASAQRSVQPPSSARASSPWSTRPAGTPRRRSPLSSRRCPPIRSRRPGSGCPAVRCPDTWGRRPAGPALGRPVSTHAVSSRPVSSRRSGRVRLLPSGGGGGDRVEVAGRP